MRTEVPPHTSGKHTGSPGRHAYPLAAKAHAPRPLWEVWPSGGVLCRVQFMQRDRRQVKKRLEGASGQPSPGCGSPLCSSDDQACGSARTGPSPCAPRLPTAQEGAKHTFRQLAGTNLKISLEPPISYPS